MNCKKTMKKFYKIDGFTKFFSKKLFLAAFFSSICFLGFSSCITSKGERNTKKTDSENLEAKNLYEGKDKEILRMEIDSSKYTEVFYDDFDSPVLDREKWERCPEWERQPGMKNHGWWSDQCSYNLNGCLVLEARKNSDGRLISGGIRSISKDYGREMYKGSKGIYEIKFRVEKGSGYWYAFWILAGNDEKNVGGGATNGAELDCFELLPGKSYWKRNGRDVYEEGRLMTTLHWDGYGSAHKSKGTDGIKVTDFDKDFYENWHIYQFVWGDESYDCYLDGKLLWSMKGSDYGEGICQVPGYIKITSEFGDWGGEIDSAIKSGESRKMLVDYVKVYRQN